jgi:hypothetical protein
MTAYDNPKPVARDEADTSSTADHSTANPAATRAAQAFAKSPHMKVLNDIHQTRVARRAAR